MLTALHRVDDVLRGRPWAVRGGRPAGRIAQLVLLLVAFGAVYGAVMGGFGGVTGRRIWQVVFSGMKVPMLLLGTFALSLPSFFVVNTLLGLRSDFAYAVRALAATQVALTIVLASFAPLTVLWYVSFDSYPAAVLFNTLTFGSASLLAQRVLRRLYRPLISHDRRHRWLLWAWLAMYAFVGIQMAWVLRPFVGDPNMAPSFFRPGAWGNAYVRLFEVVTSLLR